MRKFTSVSIFKKKSSLAEVGKEPICSSTSTDVECIGGDGEGLKRELSPRDLNMIAFSGSVGTGLIIGTGKRYSTQLHTKTLANKPDSLQNGK